MITSGQTTQEMYIKDALGRVPIPIGMAIVKFAGSGSGVSKTEEFYVYGTERIAMIVPNTLGTTPSRIQYNEATYFLTDHLGNTRVAYMDSPGSDPYIINAVEEFAFANEDEMATNVRAKAMRYYPYGKVLREYDNGAGDRYLITQHERDRETGLDYRGARYYDSDIARFLSLDPLAAKYPSMSPYNYVAGNPIILVDPDGKKPLPVLKILSPSWASQKGFYVHQKANDLGTSYLFRKGIIDLGTTISLSNQLDRATEYADSKQFQTPEFSYRHAMRNGDQTPEQAKNEADAFVRERYKWARYEFDRGNKDRAFFILGVALHALQDATSPAHGGFQEWTGEESDMDEVNHVIQEYSYPGVNSNLQKVTNAFLELFFSKKDLPDTNIFEFIQIDYTNEEGTVTD